MDAASGTAAAGAGYIGLSIDPQLCCVRESSRRFIQEFGCGRRGTKLQLVGAEDSRRSLHRAEEALVENLLPYLPNLG